MTRVPRILAAGLLALCLNGGVSGQVVAPLATISSDLLALLLSGGDDPVRAIIRGDVSAIVQAASRDGLAVVKVLDGFVVVEARPSALDVLRSVPGVEAVSRDLRVVPAMAVSDRAMGGDQARGPIRGPLGLVTAPGVTGQGIGVAIVDSGIAPHPALDGKVVAAVSFVPGDPSVGDRYGHGTHIAGLVAGTARSNLTTRYRTGIAPGAHLVNVRVLGAEGQGYTSDVIAGIQWVVANRIRYRIRVMNLSLGHPVVESCVADPLCVAAERAVASGLVVVASAGNAGKDENGRPVFGSISTPGNSPSAITVAALNTWGTVSRADDTITTYSSRGPTNTDFFLKPDVAAPGNKIVSLEAVGSYLATRYPQQHVAGAGADAYFTMSGTSMAAGLVSGGVALLLESAPTLSPRQVKVTLQLTASPMPGEGVLAAGTGAVNLAAARRMSSAVPELLSALPSTTIGNRIVAASGRAYAAGGARLDQAAGTAGLRAWGLIDISQSLLPGMLNRLGRTAAARVIWGDQPTDSRGQQIIWGDQLFTTGGQQIIWGDQVFNPTGQQIIWGDQTFNPSGQQIIWGDVNTTSGNQIIWGDTSTTSGNQIIWGDSIRGDQ
ncbi:MAG: S8 family serine peptidase [Microbacteriaceae bacterium]